MTGPVKVFRDAFRGYNKDDVNAYIQKMNFEFREREADLLKRLKDTEQPAPVETRVEVDHSAEYLAKIRELEEKLAEETSKNQKFESVSARFGEIMLDAKVESEQLMSNSRSSAEQILNDAKTEAAKIVASAKEEAQIITNNAMETSKQTIRAASELALKTKADSEALADAKVKEADEYSMTVRDMAECASKEMLESSSKQAKTMISYVGDRLKHLYEEETEGYIKILGQLKFQNDHAEEKLNDFMKSFPDEMKDAEDIAGEAVGSVVKTDPIQ